MQIEFQFISMKERTREVEGTLLVCCLKFARFVAFPVPRILQILHEFMNAWWMTLFRSHHGLLSLKKTGSNGWT